MKKEYNKAKKYSEKGTITEKMNGALKSKNLRNIILENYKFKVGWIKKKFLLKYISL